MTTVKLNFELGDKKLNVKTADVEEAAKRFTTSLLFLIRVRRERRVGEDRGG